MITLVSSSSAKYCNNSISLTPALLPKLITLLNPIPEVTLQSIIATIIAPLWEINAIFPVGGIIWENDPFNGVCESVIPKLFGPIMFIPYSSPSAVNSASNLAPSPPTSLNPAVITTIFSTPFSPHSLTAVFTNTEGIVIIAKSTSPGTSVMFA